MFYFHVFRRLEKWREKVSYRLHSISENYDICDLQNQGHIVFHEGKECSLAWSVARVQFYLRTVLTQSDMLRNFGRAVSPVFYH